MSAYTQFMSKALRAYRSRHPGSTPQQAMKACAAAWRARHGGHRKVGKKGKGVLGSLLGQAVGHILPF